MLSVHGVAYLLAAFVRFVSATSAVSPAVMRLCYLHRPNQQRFQIRLNRSHRRISATIGWVNHLHRWNQTCSAPRVSAKRPPKEASDSAILVAMLQAPTQEPKNEGSSRNKGSQKCLWRHMLFFLLPLHYIFFWFDNVRCQLLSKVLLRFSQLQECLTMWITKGL